jgi:toxin CptA
MHSAPSVSYPVGRSRFHGTLLLLIGLLGAMTLLSWLLQADAVGVRHLAVVLLWLGCIALAAWHWLKSPVGELNWDGLVWTWTSGGKSLPVQPEVSLDLQAFLLLRIGTAAWGRGFWVWPERHMALVRWLPLRRAVFGKLPAVGQPHDSAHALTPDATSKEAAA